MKSNEIESYLNRPDGEHPDWQRRNALDLAGDMLSELSQTGDMDRQFYRGVLKVIFSLTTHNDSTEVEY